MIETVKFVGQIINVGTDLMGRDLLISLIDRGSKPGQFQHQALFTVAGCQSDLRVFQTAAGSLIFGEDRFDPDNRVQNIGTGVSLKGSKFVHIKNVILGSLIGQISVFDGS